MPQLRPPWPTRRASSKAWPSGRVTGVAPWMDSDTRRVRVPHVIGHRMTGLGMGRLEDSLH